MKKVVVDIVLATAMSPVFASDNWVGARPDGHAPIGVMGDHTHKTGEWMFSYRYMQMHMDGNRDGTDHFS